MVLKCPFDRLCKMLRGASVMTRRKKSDARKTKKQREKSTPPAPPARISVSKWLVGGVLLGVLVVGTFVFRQYGAKDSEVPVFSASDTGKVEPQGTVKPVAGTVPINPDFDWENIDNPAEDGWHTEVFSERANGQLKRVAKLIAKIAEGKEVGTQDLHSLTAETFSCGPLLPRQRRTVFDGDDLQIERADGDEDEAVYGPEQLIEALHELAAPWLGATDIRLKFKLFRVVATSDHVWTTRQFLEVFGTGPSGPVEQNALWEIRWQATDENQSPRIDWIAVKRFEQVSSTRREPWFVDSTEAALGHNKSYRQQLLHGVNHWRRRIQDTNTTTNSGMTGVAVGDVNGDGLDDLYLCQESGLPNLLWVQRPDGTADDVSHEAGVDWLFGARCALFLDIDNDGDQDLAVAFLGYVVLAENNGEGHFDLRSTLSTSQENITLTAADYDLDGDLDLYVGSLSPDVHVDTPRDGGMSAPDASFVYHDANDSAPNMLFRNEGSWNYRDVTAEVGLSANNARRTLAAAWEDFDNDGDQDLYVANDFGRNSLYRNDGATGFVDVAEDLAVEDRASGMSVTWGDYDRDGRMDLYVGNMFSAAGNRITFQNGFKPDISGQKRAIYQRFAKGNTLYRNANDGSFEEVSALASVEMGRWAWSSNFADINNDGWEDLIVANGYITTDDTGDL